ILIQDYMENLEKFLNTDTNDNELVRTALIHYQFEAIHPFSDGNGRIGRIIIPLYLFKKKILYQPILYLSGFFEKNRRNYIDTLHKVDTSSRYEDWIKFFLIAVAKQAIETQKLIDQIESLRAAVEEKSAKIMSPYAHG
ncbi:MAG: Fic family cell division protein, partial [Candidatus Berkelbacteria bacterium]|nr:Fic family cell division protein [Candidatus Berkelbacteria bacterium]